MERLSQARADGCRVVGCFLSQVTQTHTLLNIHIHRDTLSSWRPHFEMMRSGFYIQYDIWSCAFSFCSSEVCTRTHTHRETDCVFSPSLSGVYVPPHTHTDAATDTHSSDKALIMASTPPASHSRWGWEVGLPLHHSTSHPPNFHPSFPLWVCC